MQALIIENGSSIPAIISAFLRDNSALFSQVKYIFRAREESEYGLVVDIQKTQALVILSSFTHKDQLESLVRALVDGPLKEHLCKFYIWSVCSYLNDWNKKTSTGAYDWAARAGFMDHSSFIQRVAKLVEQERIFTFEQDVDVPKVEDKEWPKANPPYYLRNRYTAKLVVYDKDRDLFYPQGEDPDLYEW